MRRNRNITCAVILILGIFIYSAFGQNTDNKNSADRALQSSGRVNPSTLGMEIDIPLGSYPGRGINVPISLSYSSKQWRMASMGQQPVPGGNYSPCWSQYLTFFAEESASGWTTSMAVPYIEYTGANNRYQFDGSPVSYSNVDCPTTEPPPGSYPYFLIRRLVAHLPSGETHELRIDDTAFEFAVGTVPPDSFWDGTYYAADGSNIKYVRNSVSNLYRLLMPDGSFYDFDGSTPGTGNRKATKFTDRNGNFTTYYAPNSVDDQGVTHPNGYWKDTLGRNLSIPLKPNAPNAPTPAGSPQIYQMPGMTAATPLTYKLHWKNLNGGTQAESALTDIAGLNYQLKYIGDRYVCNNSQGYPTYCTRPAGTSLFVGGEEIIFGGFLFNPVVLTEIELPTGQKYKFTYDVYGRIEQIIYPTGGVEKFQYEVVPTLSQLEPDDLAGMANFGVIDRKVYPTSGQTENYHWTYSAAQLGSTGYQVTINNPDGTRSERVVFQGNGVNVVPQFGYDNGLTGMAYEERAYNSANQMVSKKLTSWTKKSFGYADWHPRVTQEESVLYENGNGISATMKYFYDGNLDLRETPLLQNKTEQYSFVVAGSVPPATPIRTTETTYSTASVYLTQNLVGLATSSQVKDSAGNVVSRSEMSYDDSGYSPGYRGNPTTSRVWDSSKGSDTNSAAYISTRARFDTWGNQYESIDAKGISTLTEFDPTYHAFPIKVTSAIPDPSGANGSNTPFVTEMTYDFTTGLPLTTKDANGLETRIAYDPITLRPLNTKTYYNNVQVGSTAETIYHDEPNNFWVKNRSQIDTDKWSESITYFDGLGRAYKTEDVDAQGNIFVEKEFDFAGRPKRVTNPFRANEVKQWTTNVYDEASRVREVVTPDGAKIVTDYGVSITGMIGVTKQITDQAGKKRLGISDALGRMIRVVEDPAGQNLTTDYVFDTLGNLRKTIQGGQSRFFMHDSLGRLLFSKQPEQDPNPTFTATDSITGNTQWSNKYEYDNNGNITKTTDARGVFVAGTYDNFNRLKLRDYSDTTPDVNFYYDGKGLPAIPNFSKGKTTKVTSNISEARYTSFDNLGRLLTSEQRTPFSSTETIATAIPKTFVYKYNLSGALIEETYPSGRVVKNTLDNDGDLALVQSRRNANFGFVKYAQGFAYNSAGAVEKLHLGNGRWETAVYNSRLQVTQLGLGATDTTQNILKLEFDYNTAGLMDNNGSMRSQKMTVPTLGSNTGFIATQTYAYDNLNRLQSATENINAQTTASWKQTFTYDRFGNRRFDASNTTTINLASPSKVTNPLINQTDNRLTKDQDGDTLTDYDYDKAGNLTRDAEGKTFLYDAENHQTQVKNSANVSLGNYFYDGEGRRVKKVSATETTIFVYDGGGQLVAEYSTQIATTPQVSYLTTDHLGSPRVITDQFGAVIARKDFAAFGDETFTPERTNALGYKPENIRQDYTGYQKDDESGLEFAQARYFNAAHGRFTSVDPLMASANVKNPQTFNRYSYVLNSPYKFTDPLGLISSSTGACGQRCQNSDGGGGGFGESRTFGGQEISFDLKKQRARQSDGLFSAMASISLARSKAQTNWGGKSPLIRFQLSDSGRPNPSNPGPTCIGGCTSNPVPDKDDVIFNGQPGVSVDEVFQVGDDINYRRGYGATFTVEIRRIRDGNPSTGYSYEVDTNVRRSETAAGTADTGVIELPSISLVGGTFGRGVQEESNVPQDIAEINNLADGTSQSYDGRLTLFDRSTGTKVAQIGFTETASVENRGVVVSITETSRQVFRGSRILRK